ncbi:hypothetical protein CPSG_03753 [Coccidioides posadasii str. Silveira]|uniref:Uncharacterized protein n=1 Tax=Coccidioides posadasii (strain RMSCC 757 / Silveira) TaxID=443226 RepID=E9D2F5_COCPS|nr:hypothetical protein CPSG_03753 [Coccidioides posadasii str. Silveira]
MKTWDLTTCESLPLPLSWRCRQKVHSLCFFCFGTRKQSFSETFEHQTVQHDGLIGIKHYNLQDRANNRFNARYKAQRSLRTIPFSYTSGRFLYNECIRLRER